MRSLPWWSRVVRPRLRPAPTRCHCPGLVRPWLEELERRETPATFTVTSAADTLATVNPTTTPLSQQGDLTLRQAIIDANATPGSNIINFAIPPQASGGTSTPPGPNGPPQGATLTQTIHLLAPLPTLSNTVTIDGTSQAGWQPGAPVIVLDGSGLSDPQAGYLNELAVSANNCLLEGLAFTNVMGTGHTGLALYSNGNQVYGDTFSNLAVGLALSGGASMNTIGGPSDRQGNSFSANQIAISITGLVTTQNTIKGNVIEGATSLPTRDQQTGSPSGLGIEVAAVGNTVGGTMPGEGNSFTNLRTGIKLDSVSNRKGPSVQTTRNQVYGNTLSNVINGIYITSDGNTIGGTDPSAGNVLTGATAPNGGQSSGDGILISLGNKNVVRGNTVTQFEHGAYVSGSNNSIGGTAVGAGNVFGNNYYGVELIGNKNSVQGNWIGVDAAGNAMPNFDGVVVQDFAANNTIGGTVAGSGNVITGNNHFGVRVSGVFASGNAIEGNSISGNLVGGISPSSGLAPNAPSLTKVSFVSNLFFGHYTRVQGAFTGKPLTTYRLELFDNATPDKTGPAAQGQTFYYATSVTTDRKGTAKLDVSAPLNFSLNLLTATVTDPQGNTSAFSNAVAPTR